MKNKNIGVLGLWQLGCVYATSLAKLGYKVEASDFDTKVVADLNKGKPPIFEPGMDDLIKEHKGKNLFFVDIKKVLKGKDYVFITHDLPVDDQDKVNLGLIEKTIKLIEKYGDKETVVVVSSQVILGTCRKIMKSNKNVIYFPENVRLGKAYETFLTPERIILGSDDQKIMDDFEAEFNEFNCPFVKMGLESAEMVKHALNSYLATCVSYSSELADLCEVLGANMLEVVSALKSDKRVSPFAPINPGMGFAGGTLGRDIKSLKLLGSKHKYKIKLFNSVYKVNQERIEWLIRKMKSKLGKLKGLNIGILGLTYKPGTNTLRRSMSLELAEKLNKLGVKISAHDPVINEKIEKFEYIDIKKKNNFFKELDALVLMTEWPEFKEIEASEVSKLMKEKIVFDTKNFLDKKNYEDNKFLYVGTGI